MTACLLNIGKCLADSGRYNAARQHYSVCLRLALRHADLLHCALVRLNLSEVLFEEGEYSACGQMAREAGDSFKAIEHSIGAADSLRIVAKAAAESGDRLQAEAAFQGGLDLNRRVGYSLGEAEVSRDYALALLRFGCRDTARGYLKEAETIFRYLGISREADLARITLGQLEAKTPQEYRKAVRESPPPTRPELNEVTDHV